MPAGLSRIVGARIDPALLDVLEVARAFEGSASMQEFMRPHIEELARRLAAEPEIASALKLRQEYRARKSGKLRRLKEDTETS